MIDRISWLPRVTSPSSVRVHSTWSKAKSSRTKKTAKKERFYELDFIDRSREIEKTCKTEIEGSEKGTKRKWKFFLKKFDEIRDESMKMKEVVVFFYSSLTISILFASGSTFPFLRIFTNWKDFLKTEKSELDSPRCSRNRRWRRSVLRAAARRLALPNTGRRSSSAFRANTLHSASLKKKARDSHFKSGFTGIVFVKTSEGVAYHVFWVSSVQLLAEHRQKHREVDRTGRFRNHPFEILLSRIWIWRVRKLRQIPEAS